MVTANQKALDSMLEQLNALVAGQGKVVDKENVQPANSNSGTCTGGTARKKKKRHHCKKHVFHAAAACYELEANTSKGWMGWKSVKVNEVAAA